MTEISLFEHLPPGDSARTSDNSLLWRWYCRDPLPSPCPATHTEAWNVATFEPCVRVGRSSPRHNSAHQVYLWSHREDWRRENAKLQGMIYNIMQCNTIIQCKNTCMTWSWAWHVNRLKGDRWTSRVTTWRPYDKRRQGRYLKRFILNVIPFSHAFASQLGPANFV